MPQFMLHPSSDCGREMGEIRLGEISRSLSVQVTCATMKVYWEFVHSQTNDLGPAVRNSCTNS